MGFVKRMLRKNNSRNQDEEKLFKALNEGVDLIDRSEIKPLVAELKAL